MKKFIVSLSWFSKLMILLIVPIVISLSSWVVPFYIGEEILGVIPRCWGNQPENEKYMYVIIIASVGIWFAITRKLQEYTEICNHNV